VVALLQSDSPDLRLTWNSADLQYVANGQLRQPLLGPSLLTALPCALSTCKRRLVFFFQPQRLVSVLNVGIFLYSLPMTPQQESGGQQPLHPYRTPGMDAACADAHLGSETKAETITEACCCVVVDACCIYPAQELLSSVLVLCNNMRTVMVMTILMVMVMRHAEWCSVAEHLASASFQHSKHTHQHCCHCLLGLMAHVLTKASIPQYISYVLSFCI